ncbi:MAG: HPr family phosphocarrier protein [Ruminococcaceae bacterium]|nr:HPr family phosphocarrier protein [Oscillospiraceae bacterium]
MKTFEYTIADPVGIHARPAGILIKEIKRYDGVSVTVTKGGKTANALRLMALIGLGIKQGDPVTVSVEGENEEEVAARVEEFFHTYF